MSVSRVKRVTVKTRSGAYPVIVGMHLEREVVSAVKREGARRIAIIADTTTEKLWGRTMLRLLRKSGRSAEMVSFISGERHKTQETVTKLQNALLKKKFGRDSLIIALGGGVVGDIAGFVAATYMRGIPYIHLPTTLLSMVDSSVGGKVGIDTEFGKNTVGAFWQPKAVISDIQYLKDLPKAQFINGLFEAIKTFLTSDKKSLARVQHITLDKPLHTARAVQELVYRSVAIKAGIVRRDEREENERRVVNFGHTIGHAIELLSGFRMPHGFAVGYGMLVEAKVSELLGILSPQDFSAISAYLASFGIRARALRRFSIANILKATKRDKKTRAGAPHYVLLKKIGLVYTKGGQYAHPVEDNIVRRAYESLVYPVR